MLEPAETSYFSAPSAGLDPRLFKDGKLSSTVRSAILQLLFNHLNERFTGASNWSIVWLAGSGVSYQWAAQRDPGDLDCLVGVDFPLFRQSNTQFARLSDREIAQMFNEGFRSDLQPRTGHFMGAYELTFYVNIKTNIADIKPYAAYSVTDDAWTVPPQPITPVTNPDWEANVEADRKQTVEVLTRYLTAKANYESATNEAVKANARSNMRKAMSQAVALYEEIHSGRSEAFSPTGAGYLDFANYRWQSGKKTGAIQALRSVKDEMDAADKEFNASTYGVDLPDARTLVRRAASQYL